MLVMTDDVLRGLTTDYPDNIPVDKLRAAMTEVDLDAILGEWLDGVVTDGGKAYSECVLAYIKEGK